jgi:hypothetical protein
MQKRCFGALIRRPRFARRMSQPERCSGRLAVGGSAQLARCDNFRRDNRDPSLTRSIDAQGGPAESWCTPFAPSAIAPLIRCDPIRLDEVAPLQGLAENGASRTRTGDLLGAIQRQLGPGGGDGARSACVCGRFAIRSEDREYASGRRRRHRGCSSRAIAAVASGMAGRDSALGSRRQADLSRDRRAQSHAPTRPPSAGDRAAAGAPAAIGGAGAGGGVIVTRSNAAILRDQAARRS